MNRPALNEEARRRKELLSKRPTLRTELATYVRQHPGAFEAGGRLLDENFSEQRLREARLAADRDVGLSKGGDGCWVDGGAAGPLASHASRRVRIRLPHAAIDPDRLVAEGVSPLRRLAAAVAWAAYREHGRETDEEMSLAEAQAVCLVARLLHDREAHAMEPLLCEFQQLPWDRWSSFNGWRYQGRQWLVGLFDHQLVESADAALGIVKVSAVAALPVEQAPPGAPGPVLAGAMLSATDIARANNVSPEALRKALERERAKNLGGWFRETEARGRNEPKYLYSASSAEVLGVVERLRTTASAERPPTRSRRS